VAALVPKGELDGEMGDAHMAMQARLMSQALRKLSHSLSLSQSILIFINQVTAKIVYYAVVNLPLKIVRLIYFPYCCCLASICPLSKCKIQDMALHVSL